MATQVHPVVIIGAGFSGLGCANALIRSHGMNPNDILILEASSGVGGRVRQVTDFIPGFPLELGAEYCHGSITTLNKILEELNYPVHPVFVWAQGDGGPWKNPATNGIGLYYVGRDKKLIRFDDTSEHDFNHLHDVLKQISDEPSQQGLDQTCRDFLIQRGVSDRMLAMAEAGYANTLGSTLSKLSFRGVQNIERALDLDGEGDIRMNHTFANLVTHLSSNLQIQVNSVVREIQYDDPNVIAIRLQNGERVYCRHVVLTPSIAVLQSNLIQFSPHLPVEKQIAINQQSMDRVMKIILLFNDQFYPSDLHGMVCADCPVPEIWFRTIHASNGQTYYLAVGFLMSQFVEKMLPLSSEQRVSKAVRQLDEIFGTKYNSRGASGCFIKGVMHDWATEPFILGGYSYPKPNASFRVCENIATPVNNKLFFAGEGTTYAAGTLHGALDSGKRVATEVINALNLSTTKPSTIVSGVDMTNTSKCPYQNLRSNL